MHRPDAVLPAAAVFTAAAGLIHLDAAADHHGRLGAAFAVLAAVQLATSVALGLRRGGWTAAAAVLVNLVPAAGWLASRTVGLTGVDRLDALPVGVSDAGATAVEMLAMTALAFRNGSAVLRATAGRALGAATVAVAAAVTVAALATPHDHNHERRQSGPEPHHDHARSHPR